MGPVRFSVFTKAWKTVPIAELGGQVAAMGFDGIELPVRLGFQVTPDNVGQALPEAARRLAASGVAICSISPQGFRVTRDAILACAQAGVPVIRVMVDCYQSDYLAAEAAAITHFTEIVPLLEEHGVTVGVQNHCNRYVTSAIGLLRVVERFDPRRVAAVWDPAHCALAGEDPDVAAEILEGRLCMVNLKNALWRRTDATAAGTPKWKPHWTTGREGLADWSAVAAELRKRNYRGVVCLPAEYDEAEPVEQLAADDLAYAKTLFE